MIQNQQLSLDDHSSIESFSEQYIVKEAYVEEYVTHLQQLVWIKEMKSNDRKLQVAAKRSKTVEDYDWERMLTDGTIGKLTVPELNKYLEHHNLPLKGRKPDKIRTIAAHISSDFLHGHATVHVHPDSDEEGGNEEIIAEIQSESETDSDDIQTEQNTIDSPIENTVQPVTSRSGRTVKRKEYGDFHMY